VSLCPSAHSRAHYSISGEEKPREDEDVVEKQRRKRGDKEVPKTDVGKSKVEGGNKMNGKKIKRKELRRTIT
jgi:hypothetical protein